MGTQRTLWKDLVAYSEEHGLLAKQLYVVFSDPTNGIGPVMDSLDQHVEYQQKLEKEGIMFAAGPFASDDLQEWKGDGMFIYRADSLEAATKLAEGDPMHTNGGPHVPGSAVAAE
jgi:uncharacterized protein YciI